MSKRLSPYATAQLLLVNAKLYETERGRDISRYRFSETTLRRISRRGALRKSFLAQLEDEIAELGWLFVALGTDYAVISLARSDGWVKLSAKRLAEQSLLNASEEDIDEAFLRNFPTPNDNDFDSIE